MKIFKRFAIWPPSFRLRREVAPYAESAIIAFIYVGVGFWANPDDPLFVHGNIVLPLLLLSLLTLYHGLSAALITNGIFGLVMLLHYQPIPYIIFLKLLILTLILGEFHFYWYRKNLKASQELYYAQLKLDEITRAFYTLKLSHDQLERTYVTKPMSLRSAISNIEKIAKREKERAVHEFLQFVKINFSVESSVLVFMERKKIESSYGEADFSSDDPMVEKAISSQSAVYISEAESETGSRYLAVLPFFNTQEHRPHALFCIEKMPFLAFNRDNLIAISILVSYFIDELHKMVNLKNIDIDLPVDDDMLYEILRLNKFHQKFGVNATLLIFKVSDQLLSHLLDEKIKKSLRALDMYSQFTQSKGENVQNIFFLLFPFADTPSAQGFVNRLFQLLDIDATTKKRDIVYSIFNIKDMDLAITYAKEI